jgi:PAS domain S-box-containing protein
LRTLTAIFALAVFYFCAGKLSLFLAYVHPSASAVWPPSGLALAALLLWGYRLWPGIFLGAFLVNITTAGSLETTVGIAVGNTLEALLGAWLINCFADGPKAFERAKNIFKFALLAAILSTVLGATLGVTMLSLEGFAQWQQYAAIWLTWWLGDMTGDLLVAPLLVIWVTQPYPELKAGRISEAAGLLVSLILVGYIVFFARTHLILESIVILPLLWAAFRFGQRGAVTAAFLMSSIALGGTLRGIGPFATEDLNESLLRLQGFMGTIAVAGLVLASVITERARAEQWLHLRDAVSRILADPLDLKGAGAKILQVLCERTGWNVGSIWKLDQAANELACVAFWHLPSIETSRFEAGTWDRRFARGVGLPGRVWSSGHAAWISDVTKDPDFPRATLAANEGLRAAVGLPIKVEGEIQGVIECFSREVREPDDHFLGMVTDIGGQLGQFIERKRTEEALLQSERELADFFDTASLGLHWVGPDGTILRANQAELKMLGYSEQEYVGHNIAEFHVDAEVIKDILKRFAGGDILEEYPARMRCKDGSIREVLINSSGYWKNDEFIHTRCFTRDVTDLKRAEVARARHAAIVESSDDAIISKDLNGIITSWNAAAQRLFGYRAEEIIGQSIMRIIPPECQDEEINTLSRLRRGERIQQHETARVNREGRRVDVSLTTSPIKNSEGNIIGASKIARDITKRKRAEEFLRQAKEELLKANEQLETRVRERTADLERANAALVKNMEEQKSLQEQLRQAQKMESIGTLAGGIAHDFNNVLNIIQGYATLISRQSSGNHEIADSLKVINEEIERGASVVRQLLTVARKTETHLKPTHANEVALRVGELIKQTFPKTIDLAMDLDRTLPPVLADPNQISQALLNICVNARDAMPTGGKLTIRTEVIDGDKLRDHHPDSRTDPYICIGVADTGTGVDESVRRRIFEPFFTTKAFGEGTGLGLAMVYGIMKNHNGIIDVESESGRGTTFRLYLPVLRSDEKSAVDETMRREAPVRQQPHHRGIVFVVEDEESMVCLLRKSLLEAGYQILAAMDGQEAIALYHCHKEEIDIVLLDLGLPKVTGEHVIRALKEENPLVKIIVATGYLEPELKSELFQAGVKDYIQKPYLVKDLLEKLTSIVESS